MITAVQGLLPPIVQAASIAMTTPQSTVNPKNANTTTAVVIQNTIEWLLVD
jgi:hypothetical protein